MANDGVSLRVAPGEIHPVPGENGAGKSTLMNIIFGAAQPDAGSIRFNGDVVQMRLPDVATIVVLALMSRNPVWLGVNMLASLGKVFRPMA